MNFFGSFFTFCTISVRIGRNSVRGEWGVRSRITLNFLIK